MGSLIHSIENIFCEQEKVIEHNKLLEMIESNISEELQPLKVRFLLYNDKKKVFHTLDKIPVFSSPDFISLYEKLEPLGKSFIVNDSYYFPFGVLDKALGCIMVSVKSEDRTLNVNELNDLQMIANLLRGFTSLGAGLYGDDSTEDILRKNKSVVFGEIASGVLHDLNNVMGAILGRAQLGMMKFKRNQDSKVLYESLEMVENIAKSGSRITKRLRNFSKISTSIKPKNISLKQVALSSLDMLEPKLKEQKENYAKDITIENNIPQELKITSDPTVLEEIFFNLVNNSIDSIEKTGTIILEAVEDRFNVSIIIKDDGVGMSEDVAQKLGTMYYTTKGNSGQGVGIAVVQNLLSLQGGALSFDSQIGVGTKATFVLPKMHENHNEVEPLKVDFNFNPVGDGCEILLIEDNASMRTVIEEILSGFGYTVKSADCGEDGIAMYEKGDFEIVFLDIGLPDMNGVDVAKKIRSMSTDVSIAAITGWGDKYDDSELFDTTISKPFNIDEIKHFLSKKPIETIVIENIFTRDVS